MSTAVAVPPPAPAVAPVRALSAGRVIGRSFSVWLGNFIPFSVVTLVVYLPAFVLAAVAPEGGAANSGWNAADRIVSMLCGFVATGALTYGVLQSLDGRPARTRAQLAVGFRKLGSVFAVSFGVGLVTFVGAVLLVVPGIVAYCALYAAVPAAVVERELPSGAYRRSRELTKGSRWQIFAVSVVMLFVMLLAIGAAGAIGAALADVLPHPIPALFVTVVIALVSALGASASAVAYHDLRIAKEGVDTATLAKVFE